MCKVSGSVFIISYDSKFLYTVESERICDVKSLICFDLNGYFYI